jgi:hypothetical protein
MVPSTEKYLDRSKVKRSKKEEEERNAAISILASIYNEIIKFLLSAVPLSSLPFIQNQAASTSQSVAGDTYDAFTRAAAYTGYKGYKAGSVATPFSSALKEEKN